MFMHSRTVTLTILAIRPDGETRNHNKSSEKSAARIQAESNDGKVTVVLTPSHGRNSKTQSNEISAISKEDDQTQSKREWKAGRVCALR